MSSSFATPNDSVNQPIFSVTLPSKFCPAVQINQSNYNGNVNPYTIRITVAGIISIQTYTLNATIAPTQNFSYYSNSVAGTSGAGGASGSGGSGAEENGGASGSSDPGTSSDIIGGNSTPGSGEASKQLP